MGYQDQENSQTNPTTILQRGSGRIKDKNVTKIQEVKSKRISECMEADFWSVKEQSAEIRPYFSGYPVHCVYASLIISWLYLQQSVFPKLPNNLFNDLKQESN